MREELHHLADLLPKAELRPAPGLIRAHAAGDHGLLRHAEGPLLVPSPVLGETGYLLQSRAGPQAEVTFLRSSGGDGFKVAARIASHAAPTVLIPSPIADTANAGSRRRSTGLAVTGE